MVGKGRRGEGERREEREKSAFRKHKTQQKKYINSTQIKSFLYVENTQINLVFGFSLVCIIVFVTVIH